MRNRMPRAMLLVSVVVFTQLCSFADEPKELSVKTVSAALFKNGFTVIRQEADIPAEGIYRWSSVPIAAHGTFFIDSGWNIEVRSTVQEVRTPIENDIGAITDLTGEEVVVRTSTDNGGEYRGTIVTPKGLPMNSLLLETVENTRRMHNAYGRYDAYAMNTGGYLTLKQPNGSFVQINPANILSIVTVGKPQTRPERKPVFLFTAKKSDKPADTKLRLFYLTKGATWSPSYQVNILDNKKLSIEQFACIRNEWLPIQDAEIALVSGFPQIIAGDVRSLSSPTITLQQFFEQLQYAERPAQQRNNNFTSNMMRQSAEPYNDNDFDLTTLNVSGEGPDIHYNVIGKKTLDTGDTLSLSTGKAEAEYRRVLQCSISDRHYYSRNSNEPSSPPEVVDVLKFKNPLPFPMTTAPAAVTQDGKFLGQNGSYWANPLQTATVEITKVMNVRVNYTETYDDNGDFRKSSKLKSAPISIVPVQVLDSDSEDQPLGSTWVINGRTYWLRPVTAKFEIINQRNEEIELELNSVFWGGDLKNVKTDVEPVTRTVHANNAYDYRRDWPWINGSLDLSWKIPLKAGEKKTVKVTGGRWWTD